MKTKAFTLIELLVVLFIIGILSALLLPLFVAAKNKVSPRVQAEESAPAMDRFLQIGQPQHLDVEGNVILYILKDKTTGAEYILTDNPYRSATLTPVTPAK